jgi:hypothetical protein
VIHYCKSLEEDENLFYLEMLFVVLVDNGAATVSHYRHMKIKILIVVVDSMPYLA